MAIIINEFEIITDPGQSQQNSPPPGQATAQAAQAAQPLRPEQIVRAQRLNEQRRRRVRAS